MAACPQEEVAVVPAHDRPPYLETTGALMAALAQQGIAAHIHPPEALQNGVCPKLWAALGSRAVTAVRRYDAHTPLVAGLILDRRLLQTSQPATGVLLPHPPQRLWHWLRLLFPTARHIVLLHADSDPARLAAIARLVRQARLRLTLLALEVPQGNFARLQSLPADADVLWIDGQAFTPDIARAILMAAYRRRIPAVGLSRQWVEAGAAFALDWDYRDLGAQIAALIARWWRTPQSDPPVPQPPRRAILVLNREVLHHLGRRIPKNLPPETVLLP
ncbi:putative ABC transport system substrate-binding protein [Methylomarinovum caldicuralii]|uniref:ABC transport system substrate-binding protein n=2 Tax=Methylomarinovum caldicuralii TaxID=438856 RepID=A0AAU9CS53_9GAMM|nr:putative ABC transport system substrate-binding protein [Methylomarinovum caldicuralii]